MADEKWDTKGSAEDDDGDFQINSSGIKRGEEKYSESKDGGSSDLALALDEKMEYARNLQNGEDIPPHEREVMVQFRFDDGTSMKHAFKMGHTVEVLKSHLARELDVPMMEQRLYLDERLMFDPLCLTDFPSIDPVKLVEIRVEIPTNSSESKS